jgi:hypothetical protein
VSTKYFLLLPAILFVYSYTPIDQYAYPGMSELESTSSTELIFFKGELLSF